MWVKLLHPGVQGALDLNGLTHCSGAREAAGCTLSTRSQQRCGGQTPHGGSEARCWQRALQSRPGEGPVRPESPVDVRRPLSSTCRGPAGTGVVCYFYFVSSKMAAWETNKRLITQIWADSKSITLQGYLTLVACGQACRHCLGVTADNKEATITHQ